jgi:hypothetical protein
MRKVIAALLAAATLATPALAQRDRGGEGMQPRGEDTIRDNDERRAVARAGMRQALSPRNEASRQERREWRQERRDDRQDFRGERRDDRQGFRQERREDRQEFRQERREDRQDLRQGDVTRREFRRDRADDVRDFRRDRWDDRQDFRRDRWQDRQEFRRDRLQDGRRWGWDDDRRWNGNRWNQGWRQDRRYNWQDWRFRNRNVYRLPRYYAPPGWGYGYRRFGLGVILSAPLFSQNYWIDDPYNYRLPPAYGPYRWIRYYDDVLLVDIRDGRVVDVIHDFFW